MFANELAALKQRMVQTPQPAAAGNYRNPDHRDSLSHSQQQAESDHVKLSFQQELKDASDKQDLVLKMTLEREQAKLDALEQNFALASEKLVIELDEFRRENEELRTQLALHNSSQLGCRVMEEELATMKARYKDQMNNLQALADKDQEAMYCALTARDQADKAREQLEQHLEQQLKEQTAARLEDAMDKQDLVLRVTLEREAATVAELENQLKMKDDLLAKQQQQVSLNSRYSLYSRQGFNSLFNISHLQCCRLAHTTTLKCHRHSHGIEGSRKRRSPPSSFSSQPSSDHKTGLSLTRPSLISSVHTKVGLLSTQFRLNYLVSNI